MFEPLSTAGSATEPAERGRERQFIPARCCPALMTYSIYMKEGGKGVGAGGNI